MADTVITANLIQKAWAKDLWTAAQKSLYFNKFMGESPDYIIQKKTDLKKEAGDSIVIPLLAKLEQDGVTGDDMLEGNEEALQFYDFSVSVDQIRHAVRLKGKMEEQKTQIDLRRAAKSGLQTWLSEMLDKSIFKALTAAPTTNRILYAGTRTVENTITDNDKFTASLISRAKRKAMLAGAPVAITLAGTCAVTNGSPTVTGTTTAFDTAVQIGDRIVIGAQERRVIAVASATSLTVDKNFTSTASGVANCYVKRLLGGKSKIRPVKVDGKETYVMILHPWQVRDLRSDTEWIAAQQNANVRGNDNPILSGALGIYDGVVKCA